MGAVIFIIVMASIFLITGMFLIAGKGSFLIAGYNMASPEEKARYDEKKLCRANGVVLFIVSIMLVIMAYLGYRVEKGLMPEDNMLTFAIVFIAVVLTSVGVSMYYCNKKCKKF